MAKNSAFLPNSFFTRLIFYEMIWVNVALSARPIANLFLPVFN